MKKKLVFIVVIIISLGLGISSCTKNERAKNFGGTIEHNLPKGEKLIMVTWKNDDMWTLTREMKKEELPERYTFQEESSYGIMEGTVIIIESK